MQYGQVLVGRRGRDHIGPTGQAHHGLHVLLELMIEAGVDAAVQVVIVLVIIHLKVTR